MVDLLEGQAFTVLSVYTVGLSVTAQESRTHGGGEALQMWAANTSTTFLPHCLDRGGTKVQDSSDDLGNHWAQRPWTWDKGLDCPLRGRNIGDLSYSPSLLKDLEDLTSGDTE